MSSSNYPDWKNMTHHGDDEPTFVSSPEEMKAAVLQRHDRQRMVQQAWEDELRGFLDAQPVNHLVTLRKILVMCGGDTRHYITGMLTGILQFERRVCSECGEDHSAVPIDMRGFADQARVPPVEVTHSLRETLDWEDPTGPAGNQDLKPADGVDQEGIQGVLFDEDMGALEAQMRSINLPDGGTCCCSTNTPDTRCYRCKESNHQTCSDSGAFPRPRPEAAGVTPLAPEAPPTRQEQLRAALGLTAEDIANMATYWLDDAWSNDGTKFLGYVCTGTGPTKGACGVVYPSIADRMLKDPDECHGCNLRGRWG